MDVGGSSRLDLDAASNPRHLRMSRRQFSAVAAGIGGGALASCAPLRSDASAAPKPLTRIGIQLWTIRDSFEADPLAALQAVAASGYQEVEFGGGNFFARDPMELRDILDETTLAAPSLHVGTGELTSQMDRVVEMAMAVGAGYVVVPAVGTEMRGSVEAWRGVGRLFTEAAKRLADDGLQFAYHNHDFEFDEIDGATNGFDVLFGETDPELVKIELDFFWATYAKQDPAAIMQANPGRVRLCHMKDLNADGEMCFPGEGAIDFQSLFLHSKAAGLEHFYVEYDHLAVVDLGRMRAANRHLYGMTLS